MSNLTEVRGQIEERRARLHEIFEQAGDDYDMTKVTLLEGDSKSKAEQIKALNDEMTDLGKEADSLAALEGIHGGLDALGQVDRAGMFPNGQGKQAGAQRAVDATHKTLGELFIESPAHQGWRRGMSEGPAAHLDVDVMATLFQTSAGWAPADIRGPKLVDLATRPIRVIDLFPQTTTTAASIVYMEETTFTNAAVEVAEGLAKPEATLALTEVTSPVRKIAVWIPVTDEQLEDVPQVRGYLDNRLGFMVRQRLDSQLLVGDGTAPNLSGILDRSGLQTQAKGADPTPDAVYKAMTKIRVNAFAEPNAAVFHPNDWQDVRLLRTADGIYIWGSPADAGPERIWGLTVVQSTALTENTGLVGDFQQADVAFRSGLDLQVSNSHSDYFIKNLQAVRAELRVALQVYRPAAFASVTGI